MTEIKPTASPTVTPLKAAQPQAPASGEGGFFGTLLDIVNPLQHIPVVSSLYREATGDGISGFANLVGGGLFGGILGAASSLANIAVEGATGKDIAGNLLPDGTTAPTVADAYPVASATPLVATPGTALLGATYIGTPDSPQTAAAAETQATLPDSNLEQYRDPSLGLKEQGKQEQYLSKLDKIAIDMKG